LFVLGHLGIGSRLLFGLRRRLPWWPLYAGCLLPDLIDKPLYYALLWLHRLPELISGTRTFGHSGLFLLALLLLAALARRPWAWALFAGVATHFALDIAGELFTSPDPESSIWIAILFPALGVRFPMAHFGSLLEHLTVSAQSAYVIVGELLGAIILLRARIHQHQPDPGHQNEHEHQPDPEHQNEHGHQHGSD
jgi:hypothetical protein